MSPANPSGPPAPQQPAAEQPQAPGPVMPGRHGSPGTGADDPGQGSGSGPAPGSGADDGNAFWGEDGTDGTDGTGGGHRRRKRRWPRILIAVGVFAALVVAGTGALLWQRQSSYNGNIDRMHGVMPGGKRPGPNVTGTENWLLVGSDTRADASTTGDGNDVWKPGRQRSDTIMLLHLPADRGKAYVISFPRDSWVSIPGYGNQKINAAFSFGGPKLLIETVEHLTGARVDHFGAIDFAGFKTMTDALGGVEVDIKQSVYDPARKVNWTAGRQKLDGEKALLFVRQRYNLPNGDFDRIRRQQAFLGALAKKAANGGTVSNPLKLDRFLSAFTKSISVDDDVSAGKLRSLAISLRGIRAGDVQFLTAPNRGSAQRGKQSVVLLDKARSSALFEAVKSAEMAGYVKRYGGVNSVGTVS